VGCVVLSAPADCVATQECATCAMALRKPPVQHAGEDKACCATVVCHACAQYTAGLYHLTLNAAGSIVVQAAFEVLLQTDTRADEPQAPVGATWTWPWPPGQGLCKDPHLCKDPL
jgi:hypothetical protein